MASRYMDPGQGLAWVRHGEEGSVPAANRASSIIASLRHIPNISPSADWHDVSSWAGLGRKGRDGRDWTDLASVFSCADCS